MHITSKIDTGSDGSLMPFKVFRILFLKSTLVALYATNTKSVVLKTYSQSNIKHLGVCTIRLRHKDQDVKCSFFVVPGHGPELIGMLDIELLNILKIIGDPYEAGSSIHRQ